MPVCQKCDTKFPNKVLLDGKYRNLQRRKYCLECSPFGSKNTKQLHIKKKPRYCQYCGKENSRSTKLCTACLNRARRYETKLRAINLLGGKCNRCGWAGHISGFQFHHLGDKEFAIGRYLNLAWEALEEEFKKCELLCGLCHAEEHSAYSDDFIKYLEKNHSDSYKF